MFGETKFQVKGLLDGEGNAKVSVTAVKPYGPDRTATATAEITDKKVLAAIGKELKAAIVDIREELGEQVLEHAAESYAIASKRGEFKKKATSK